LNIDFAHNAAFSTYVLLLIATGIVMVAIGGPIVRKQTRLQRSLNIAFGIGFLAYGFYLAFLFKGGTYFIFFKAFLLPVLLIARTIRGARAVKTPAGQPMHYSYPPTALPAGYPQPGFPQPGYPQAGMTPAGQQPADANAYWAPPPAGAQSPAQP